VKGNAKWSVPGREMGEIFSSLYMVPAIQRGIGLVGRFLGGIFLSRAVIFEGWAPFGLGWQAASGGGLGGLVALLGSLLGYMSLGQDVQSLKYIAVVILIYAGNLIFRETGFAKNIIFAPLMAGVVSVFVGIVFVEGDPSMFLFFACEIILIVGAGYFYSVSGSKRSAGGDVGYTISLLILASTLLISLSGISMVGGIAPARLIAGLFVLRTAFASGSGLGSAAGLSAGIAMDLALGYPFFSMSYGLSGLIAGVFRNTGKFLAVVAYVLAGAVAALWAGTDAMRLTALLETFAVSVIFMLMPARLNKGKRILDEGTPEVQDGCQGTDGVRIREHSRRRLEQSSMAFRELYTMLQKVFDRQKNDEDVSSVLEHASDALCRRCALRGLCWDMEMTATRQALSDAGGILAREGKITADDFPQYFTSRCIQVPKFIRLANDEMTALLNRRQYRSRLQESRNQICRQYSEVSKIFAGMAEDFQQEVIFDQGAERRIRHILSDCRIPFEVSVARVADGKNYVELTGSGLSRVLENDRDKLLKNISLAAGYPVAMPEQVCTPEYERMIFTQAETLKASIGIASHKKKGERESGDSGAWFKASDGKVYLILSDGMGTGRHAGEESREAVKLLEHFLRAGIEPEIALSTLNSALVLRGDAQTEGFVTVDLCICNLLSGQTRFFKNGASPSYIKRGHKVSQISGQGWPVGLGVNVSPGSEMTTLHMDAGDAAIMMSDGVCEMGQDPWLSRIIEAWDGESPRTLAGSILEQAVLQNGQGDDMLVLVLSLEERIG